MATWPSTLPGFAAEGYSEQVQDGVVRGQVDAGPSTRRRVSTAAPTIITDTLLLTAAQRDTLEAFFVVTLSMGAREFDWVRPGTSEGVKMAFMSPPEISAVDGVLFHARITLEMTRS